MSCTSSAEGREKLTFRQTGPVTELSRLFPATRPAGRSRPLAVLDIDGVLADVRHRLHHLQQRPKDWPAFFAAAELDPTLPAGVTLAGELAAAYEVVYLTGRPERHRESTAGWLERHRLPHGALVMRADGDHRPARLAKLDLLTALAAEATVAVIVDDDPAVCAALASAGWPVRLADWMPRPDVLADAQEREGRT